MDEDKTQAVNPDETPKEESKSFDADYVKALRAESAKHRTEAKALAQRLAELEGAKTQSEQAALAEQGRFKELYEKSAAELKALQAERDELRTQSLRQRVGMEAGLPPALIERLKGATEEELRSDAEALKALIPPTQAAPAPGARQQTTTAVPGAKSEGRSEAELKARYLKGGTGGPFSGG